MGIQEKITEYLSAYGKAHKYKIARALKMDVSEVTKALSELRERGNIEIKSGNAMLAKGEKTAAKKAVKPKKQPKVEAEKPEEDAKEEQPEEAPTEERVQETFEQKPEERIEGTVKFFNQNKGFGFITGDDEKEYYVHEGGLRKGVSMAADDRVSFKAMEGAGGPIAEDVENISQSGETNVA